MTKRKREDPKGIQFKSFAFDTKAVADEPDDDGFVYIEAYASVFDNVDSHNDIIAKGAYKDTLSAGPRRAHRSRATTTTGRSRTTRMTTSGSFRSRRRTTTASR